MGPSDLYIAATAPCRCRHAGADPIAVGRCCSPQVVAMPCSDEQATYWVPAPLQSYHRFMWEHLFSHVDIPPEAVHIPDGMVPLADVPRCARVHV